MKAIKNKRISNEKFDELIKPNINKLYKFLCAYTKDFTLAQDLLQDCLLKAYLHIPDIKDESKVTSWLYKIAINSAKDYFKKNPPAHEISNNLYKDNNAFEQTDMKCDISECLMRLSSAEREVLILKDMLNYTYSEIANMLDISQSNVGIRLYRARDKLKSIIYGTDYVVKEEEF